MDSLIQMGGLYFSLKVDNSNKEEPHYSSTLVWPKGDAQRVLKSVDLICVKDGVDLNFQIKEINRCCCRIQFSSGDYQPALDRRRMRGSGSDECVSVVVSRLNYLCRNLESSHVTKWLKNDQTVRELDIASLMVANAQCELKIVDTKYLFGIENRYRVLTKSQVEKLLDALTNSKELQALDHEKIEALWAQTREKHVLQAKEKTSPKDENKKDE